MDLNLILSLQKDLPLILSVDPGQNLDQRGLSGTVFSHQRVNLSLLKGKIHILQSAYTGKAFGNSPHFQYGFFFQTFCTPLHFYCSAAARKPFRTAVIALSQRKGTKQG